MGRFIWHNGEIKPESEAYMSVYDSSIMYGNVFEMCRSFKGEHFKLKEHIERLFYSMEYIGMKCPYSVDKLIEECILLSTWNNNEFSTDDEHRLYIVCSHGSLSIYKDVEGTVSGANIIITDFPLRWTVQGMGKIFDTGINAMIPKQRVIPSNVLDSKVKHHNRLHFLRANIEAGNYKGENNWPLLLDGDGNIAEFSGANFFMVRGNTLFTPRTTHILKGISREYVRKELCPQLKLNCVEADLTVYNASFADECFATATPFCILPVSFIAGHGIGKDATGPITRILIDQWSENVKVDIPSQIRGWNATDSGEITTSPYKWKKEL